MKGLRLPMPSIHRVLMPDLAACMIKDFNRQSAPTHLNLALCTIQENTSYSAGKCSTGMREVDQGAVHPRMHQVDKTHHAGETKQRGPQSAKNV